MTFLAPLFLALAGLAIVPLLLHLLRRKLDRRVPFPAVRYLQRAQSENQQSLRLRNIIVMLLRVTAVVLIALAAARPIARVAGVGHPPTAIALVIDNSMSSAAVVDGRPLLSLLQDAALTVLDRATSADLIWLVDASGNATGGSHSVVRAAILAMNPLKSTGDLSAALNRGVALVEGSQLAEQRVGVLSDGQRYEWRSVSPPEVKDASVHVFIPSVFRTQNRSVATVEPRPARWAPAGEIALRVAGGDSVPYRIDLGGRVLARGVAAHGDEVVVRATPSEQGWVSGVVELEPDELRSDDTRHFAVWIGPPPRVEVHASAGSFTESAIDALVESGRVERGDGIRVGAAEDTDRLPALILPPQDDVRLGAANRALERLGVPWRFGEAVTSRAPVRPALGTQWSDEGVVVLTRRRLTATAAQESDTLATANGEPWLVAGPGYVVLASHVHPEAGNLPLRASLVPLLSQLLSQWLSGSAGGVVNALPGAQLQRPIWADAVADGQGGRNPLDGSVFTAPAEPGVYDLFRTGATAGMLVVNPPPGESDLLTFTLDEVRGRLPASRGSVTSDAQQWVRSVFDGASGRPFVLPLLVLALAALITESLLARSHNLARRV